MRGRTRRPSSSRTSALTTSTRGSPCLASAAARPGWISTAVTSARSARIADFPPGAAHASRMRSPSRAPTTIAASCDARLIGRIRRGSTRSTAYAPGTSVGVPTATGEPHLERRRLVLRAHQLERHLRTEVARPHVGDPVGIRLLHRPVRQRGDEPAQAAREPPHHGVRERHGALASGGAHELDGVVDDGVLRQVGERELVGAQPQRGLDRRVELAHRTLAELLDAEVEHARPLHRPEGETLRQRTVTRIELRDGRDERAVGVGVVVERPADDLERRTPRRGDHWTPRRNSSYVIFRRPSGWTTSGTNTPPSSRALHTVSATAVQRRPRADVRRQRADTRRQASSGSSRSSSRSVGVIFSAYVQPSSGCGGEHGLREHGLELARGHLGRTLVHAAGVELADREGVLRRDRACVELFDRPVDRHARLLVAGEDRALDRRGAAPAREQRRMDVQPQRLLEQPRRDVEPVGTDDHPVDRLGELRALRLVHRDAEALGGDLRGRRPGRASPAAPRVRPRQQVRDRLGRGEPRENIGGERRRAREGDLHRRTMRGRRTRSASLRCSSSVRSMISTPSRWSSSCCTTRAP